MLTHLSLWLSSLQVSNSVVHDPSGGVPSTSFFNFNQQSQQPQPGQAPVRAPPLTPGSTQFSAQPFQTFNGGGLPPQPRFQSRPSPASGFRSQPQQQQQPQQPRGPPSTSSVFGGNFGSNGNFFSVFNPAAFASPAARDAIQC